MIPRLPPSMMFYQPLRRRSLPHLHKFTHELVVRRYSSPNTTVPRDVDVPHMSEKAKSGSLRRGWPFGVVSLLLSASILSAAIGYSVAKRYALNASLDVPDSPKFGSPDDFKKAIAELRRTFPNDNSVSTNPDDLHGHGFSDGDYLPGEFLSLICRRCLIFYIQVTPHSVIVYPESTDDVVKIVKIATKYRMPVIPYSGATSLEGHFRGVCLRTIHHIFFTQWYAYSCLSQK